ncbi:hypothetical protein [Paenibacillus sp. 32O-W]|uniref:hypothetical protein n=1 Tax=Paenibacillus sp. 32O-W TaxID=1695218 RepID=UPI000783CC1A|nr:hypothetical protein [Paenibacillus sp. 32O-W]
MASTIYSMRVKRIWSKVNNEKALDFPVMESWAFFIGFKKVLYEIEPSRKKVLLKVPTYPTMAPEVQ